jgi:hypothetical protein
LVACLYRSASSSCSFAPNRNKYRYNGIRGNIFDEIVKAQNDMKNFIAREEFHQPYNSLSTGQQDKIKQEHPVLFQKEFR